MLVFKGVEVIVGIRAHDGVRHRAGTGSLRPMSVNESFFDIARQLEDRRGRALGAAGATRRPGGR